MTNALNRQIGMRRKSRHQPFKYENNACSNPVNDFSRFRCCHLIGFKLSQSKVLLQLFVRCKSVNERGYLRQLFIPGGIKHRAFFSWQDTNFSTLRQSQHRLY